MKIFNFGSMNIDHVYQVASFPKPGETLSCLHYEKNCGGKGLNQSVALARAGASVCHVGCCGADGAFLLDMLRECGAALDFVRRDCPVSGHAVIIVDKDGQNQIILYLGANRLLDETLVDRVLETAGPKDIILMQNEVNLCEYIARKAKDKGLMVVFNSAPADGLSGFPFELIDLLILNETEGLEISGNEDAAGILSSLAIKNPRMEVILTLGRDGGIYRRGRKEITFPALNLPVVDTTGAGDTFVGYYIASAARGCTVEDSIAAASAASALAIGKTGAAGAIPYLAEVEALLRQYEEKLGHVLIKSEVSL